MLKSKENFQKPQLFDLNDSIKYELEHILCQICNSRNPIIIEKDVKIENINYICEMCKSIGDRPMIISKDYDIDKQGRNALWQCHKCGKREQTFVSDFHKFQNQQLAKLKLIGYEVSYNTFYPKEWQHIKGKLYCEECVSKLADNIMEEMLCNMMV